MSSLAVFTSAIYGFRHKSAAHCEKSPQNTANAKIPGFREFGEFAIFFL